MMRYLSILLIAACAVGSAWIYSAWADDVTACVPLQAPLYTVDTGSPVTPGLADVGDVLTADGPAIAIPRLRLGLASPLDNVDGLSLLNFGFPAHQKFALLFSVDRRSVGIVPPEPTLVLAGFPFNVLDQAVNHQAASDGFMALADFTRDGVAPLPSFAPPAANNTLLLNQGDASGVDYRLDPDISPGAAADPNETQNSVNGTAGTTPSSALTLRSISPPPVIAYTLAAGSPALLALPGTQSAADVYLAFEPNDPNDPFGVQILYAPPAALSLLPGDDIDALIVFDDGDFTFNPTFDQIIFSLERESPTLINFGLSPADVFTSTPGGGFSMFAQSELLGLGVTFDPNDPNTPLDDNVDALDFVPCDDWTVCAFDWAIGTACPPCPGDINGDSVVDLTDLGILLGQYGCTGPTCTADLNNDNIVNLTDLGLLLAAYGGPC